MIKMSKRNQEGPTTKANMEETMAVLQRCTNYLLLLLLFPKLTEKKKKSESLHK